MGINNQGAFTGEASFDLAQYAFKGPKEQRLSLSVPIHYQKHLGGEHTPVIATVEAQIISKPAEEVRVSMRMDMMAILYKDLAIREYALQK